MRPGHSKEFGALFSSRDSAMPSLSFPGCLRSFVFELKTADVCFLCKTLQVWGTTKRVGSLRKQLSMLEEELLRESYWMDQPLSAASIYRSPRKGKPNASLWQQMQLGVYQHIPFLATHQQGWVEGWRI
jgi:hypothetical protein